MNVGAAIDGVMPSLPMPILWIVMERYEPLSVKPRETILGARTAWLSSYLE